MSHHYVNQVNIWGLMGENWGTYGRGMEITTSYKVTFSFSSSYSMLTSHVPSLDGVGQQLTSRHARR